MADTNVFVAAMKHFSKRSRGSRRSTGSLSLLVRLITDDGLELFGNRWLLGEYKRLADELGSETSALILGALAGKARVVEIGDEAMGRCRPLLPEGEAADVAHAATSLQADAVLITNDRDFDRIREEGIIEVWGISEAIRKLSVLK